METPQESKDTTNAANAAYTWQNPQVAKPVANNSKLRKALYVAGGVAVFFGLAVLLAFI